MSQRLHLEKPANDDYFLTIIMFHEDKNKETTVLDILLVKEKGGITIKDFALGMKDANEGVHRIIVLDDSEDAAYRLIYDSVEDEKNDPKV